MRAKAHGSILDNKSNKKKHMTFKKNILVMTAMAFAVSTFAGVPSAFARNGADDAAEGNTNDDRGGRTSLEHANKKAGLAEKIEARKLKLAEKTAKKAAKVEEKKKKKEMKLAERKAKIEAKIAERKTKLEAKIAKKAAKLAARAARQASNDDGVNHD